MNGFFTAIAPDFNAALTMAVQILLAVFVLVVIPYLARLLRQKLAGGKYEDLAYWVDIAVHAAEQTLTQGADKKEYVLQFLAAHGLTWDGDAVDKLIEAAVWGLKNE